MIDWIKKDSTFKPIWMMSRMLLNIAIYYSLVNQPGFTDELCGPLAIPIEPSHFDILVLIQVIPFLYYIIANFLLKDNFRLQKWVQLKTPKVIITAILKLWIIFSKAQRRKYYIHLLIIEFIIWVCTIAFDCFGFPKISEAWEIMIVDSFQRISIFYVLSRTFCPYFTIYWFFTNLILLTMSQIQAHLIYYFPKSEKADPIFPGTLYVKQDIYRLMIMAFLYFGLYSFVQVSTFGYGMALTFLISCVPFINSINRVKAGQFKMALILLFYVILCLIGMLLLRIISPSLFKPFFHNYIQKCGIFDER